VSFEAIGASFRRVKKYSLRWVSFSGLANLAPFILLFEHFIQVAKFQLEILLVAMLRSFDLYWSEFFGELSLILGHFFSLMGL